MPLRLIWQACPTFQLYTLSGGGTLSHRTAAPMAIKRGGTSALLMPTVHKRCSGAGSSSDSISHPRLASSPLAGGSKTKLAVASLIVNAQYPEIQAGGGACPIAPYGTQSAT